MWKGDPLATGDTSPDVTPRAVTHYTQQPGVGHHKKAFLKLTHEGTLPQGAQSLCHYFADYKEERFAAPTRKQARESPDPEQRAIRQLTWASLNVRSIYGREKALSALMSRHQISVLALQETFERANDPPEGLPKSTFSKAADNGRRGIMVIVHPALERSAQCATELGGGDPKHPVGRIGFRRRRLLRSLSVPAGQLEKQGG